MKVLNHYVIHVKLRVHCRLTKWNLNKNLKKERDANRYSQRAQAPFNIVREHNIVHKESSQGRRLSSILPIGRAFLFLFYISSDLYKLMFYLLLSCGLAQFSLSSSICALTSCFIEVVVSVCIF